MSCCKNKMEGRHAQIQSTEVWEVYEQMVKHAAAKLVADVPAVRDADTELFEAARLLVLSVQNYHRVVTDALLNSARAKAGVAADTVPADKMGDAGVDGG